MKKKVSLAMLCLTALFSAVTVALASDDPKYGSCLYTTQIFGTHCNQSGHSCTRTGPSGGDAGGSGSYTGICKSVETFSSMTCWCIEG